jgi:tRNA dimethylallyltransferase
MPTQFAANCWFLSGPTAGGKSDIGIELARRIGAEIVSMDSMSLYRGMDIGTAKPTTTQLDAVEHHLIDVINPHEEYSIAQYLEAAERAVEGIHSRGRTALFVGGTPLYLKALLRGMFEGPAADWEVRHALEAEERQHGPGHLHRRLAEVDSKSAQRLHANDTRRLIRALEVFLKTGRPIGQWQEQFDVGLPSEACRVFVLDWPREEIYGRIDRRVERMFDAGLVEEVRGLIARPESLSRTAGQALGYREVIEHLNGCFDLPETIQRVQRHTRQFAKRQGTWFRSLSECRFVSVSGAPDATEIAARIEALQE